ncbi:PAS domain-containing sensor histidine kinase, partial [Intestinibacter sp.]|uniref:PAS domain-containing sensor histidine kinase n=1 Tax=Intestinibacter sp. TaxID=1965304 RepID=UPI002A74E75A
IDESFAKIIINSFKKQTYELYMIKVDREKQTLKIFIFRDITHMNNMEKTIQFNEKSYKKLIEFMEDGVIITDQNHISYMNKKVYDIFDIDQKKYQISSIEDLSNYVINEDKEVFIKNIITDNFFDNEKMWMIKTFNNKTVKVIENFLDYENKNFKLVIFSDVTKNQNLIEDIEEREKIYRVLLETLPDGVIIVDKITKKYIYRNKCMINMFKKVGIEKINDIVKDYIKSGEFDVEKKVDLNEKQNASIIITDIEEQNIYIVVFKVMDKKHKIDDIKYKMQKIKKAEEFKTQFCMDIVNKIEKPVNDMLYNNKQMEKNIEAPIIENHISLVRQNLYRLKKVLENIHDIMSIENYRYNLNYTVFDIVELMKNIVDLSKAYANKKDLNIETYFSEEEILVYLDSIKMQKILLNILSNAIKFTNQGGNIKMSIEKKIDFIVISIKDNGIGIPKEKIDFVFENFEQVDKSLSRLAEGMGMGLYVSKKLSDIQGIYLNVDSEVNKGSEFKVLIRNTENSFLKNKYKKHIVVEPEFVDIQLSDIYSA